MSDNLEIMIYDKADAVIEEIFCLLLIRYEIGLEISMKDSRFYLWLFSFIVLEMLWNKFESRKTIQWFHHWIEKQESNNKSCQW